MLRSFAAAPRLSSEPSAMVLEELRHLAAQRLPEHVEVGTVAAIGMPGTAEVRLRHGFALHTQRHTCIHKPPILCSE